MSAVNFSGILMELEDQQKTASANQAAVNAVEDSNMDWEGAARAATSTPRTATKRKGSKGFGGRAKR